MGNSENRPHKNSKLTKEEILRGYKAYSKVLQNSITVSTDFIIAFLNFQRNNEAIFSESGFTESPLFTNNVKVGFIIARKKIKKAVLRNRIKRLFKEAFRLNKHLFKTFPMHLNIILSLTDPGYNYFLTNKVVKYNFIESEIRKLMEKLNNYLQINK